MKLIKQFTYRQSIGANRTLIGESRLNHGELFKLVCSELNIQMDNHSSIILMLPNREFLILYYSDNKLYSCKSLIAGDTYPSPDIQIGDKIAYLQNSRHLYILEQRELFPLHTLN